MTMQILWRGVGVLTFSLASAVAVTQSPPDSLRACAALNSDHARLKCYDDAMAALGVARNAKSSPSSAAPASASGAAHGAAASASSSASAATQTPSPPPPAAPKSVAGSAAPEDFGLDAAAIRKKRGEPDPTSTAVTQLVARVKSVGHRPTGELSIELDNGQVWAETQRRAGSSVAVGDTVTIRPGKLGSYFLSTHSGFALRVARIQ